MARVIVELYMTDLATEMEAVQTTVDDIQSTVNDIETDVATVDTVVDGIVTDLATVDTLVDTLTTNLATVDTVVDAIKVVTDALATLTETGGTVTTDGNEQDVYINETPAGVYLPRMVKISTVNHTAAETIIIREYYRIASGGAYLEHDEVTYIGTIAEDEITIHLDPNRYGIKVTIQKTAGTNRDYAWEVVYEV